MDKHLSGEKIVHRFHKNRKTGSYYPKERHLHNELHKIIPLNRLDSQLPENVNNQEIDVQHQLRHPTADVRTDNIIAQAQDNDQVKEKQPYPAGMPAKCIW